MNINIFGSTGIIGTKTLKILKNYFPQININLLCANNNVRKLIKQSHTYSPKYVYINNSKYIDFLKNNVNPKSIILDNQSLFSYLKSSISDYSLLAISGYQSLQYLDVIFKNTSSIGLVSKEAIVSAGHLFNKYSKKKRSKIYPLDSEHFSIYKFINNFNNSHLVNLTLTASGGPFLGKKFSSLRNVTFKQASNHPKWKMGYKNSIDSATLSNKCLEIVEAHYLFDIPYNKLNIMIHPESLIHSIFEFKNYIYSMNAFQNDMNIPLFHFLNQNYSLILKNRNYSFNKKLKFNIDQVQLNQFPIYSLFKQIDKSDPSNIIKFNVANEHAVNLFKNNIIKYTDIYKIIAEITSLNLNYNLNNIKDILNYHELLENKIKEKAILI